MGNPDPDRGLVAPSDIADLAGVTRAAVSNWRRRRSDFPEPAGGTVAKPLFSRDDVERWLVANGHQLRRDSGGLAVWAVTNRFRDEVPLEVTRPLVLAMLCARKLADDTNEMDELNRAHDRPVLDALLTIAQRPDSDPRWRDLVTADLQLLIERYAVRKDSRRTLDRLARELFLVINGIEVANLADVSDHVLARVAATEGRMAGEHGSVGSKVSQLLAQAGSGVSGTAYDPACGIGEALLQLWQRTSDRDRLWLAGADVNREYVLVCRQRCYLYGAEATIECADVLERDPHPDLRADVVIAEPPIGLAMPTGFSVTDPRWALAGPPPKSNSETAFLQHAITHLTPQGRGFVITGLSSTFASSSTLIRRSLLQFGCVEAVLLLPPKLLLHTAIPTALWVLRQPNTPVPADQLTFIDASQLDPSEDFQLQTWLPQPEMSADRRLSWARIPVEDVLADDQVSLDPRHWTRLIVDSDQIERRYRRAASELARAIESLEQSANLIIRNPAHAARTVTLGTLEKQDALRIVHTRSKGRRDSDAGDLSEKPWVVTTRRIREGLPELPTGRPVHAPLTVFALDDVDDTYTEPGDVLVTTVRGIRAIVDETGGRTLSPGIIRVRVDQHQFEPHYVAECLAGSWNQRFETGGYIPLGSIRDLEIPLLPIDEQNYLLDSLNQARTLAAAGRHIAFASDELATAQLDAVRFEVRLLDDAVTEPGAHRHL